MYKSMAFLVSACVVGHTLCFLLAYHWPWCFSMASLSKFISSEKKLTHGFNSDRKDLKEHDMDESLFSSPLCVPQDPVEELEWYPPLGDHFMSFRNMDLYLSLLKFFDFDEQQEKNDDQKLKLGHVSGHEEKRSTQKRLFRDESNIQKNDKKMPLLHQQVQELMKVEKKPRTKKARASGQRAWRSKPKPKPKPVTNVEEKRCSHCESKETPQWRAGPMGPNTLCNACGVRYKSGRLFPEYRPAASPTFDVKKHSNFHKKILKKRGRYLLDCTTIRRD